MKRTVESYSWAQSAIVDVVCAGFLVVLLTLSLLFPSRITDASGVSVRMSLALIIHGAMTWTFHGLSDQRGRAIIRILNITIVQVFLFDQMRHFQQLLFNSWFDDSVLSIEFSLVGADATLALQRFIHPFITEAMMFSYVAYYLMLPLAAYALYRSGGSSALTEYLMNICFTLIVCYFGYIFFPVAGPLHFSRDLYTVPLEGGLFTWCGEWIRINQQYAGGSLPSAHCAAAIGMLVMLHRHNRKAFFIVLPTVLILLVATVYCRYHYLSDSIVGIATGLFVLRFSPTLVHSIEPTMRRFRAVIAQTKGVTQRVQTNA